MGNPAEETWRHRDDCSLAPLRDLARKFYSHFLPYIFQELATAHRPRFASRIGTESAPASAWPARVQTIVR